MMKIFLAELGLESLDFECGEDALFSLGGSKVSCLLSGLELADMTGEDLIRRMNLYGSSPMTVIAVTSSMDERRVRALAALGVKAVIQKGGDWKEKLREYF